MGASPRVRDIKVFRIAKKHSKHGSSYLIYRNGEFWARLQFADPSCDEAVKGIILKEHSASRIKFLWHGKEFNQEITLEDWNDMPASVPTPSRN